MQAHLPATGRAARWYATGHGFSSRLEASDDAGRFSVVLALANQKVPYEAGGIGYLPFARSGWFSYCSLTRLAASGTLRLGAEFVSVQGIGWFDHQWGDFFVTPFHNRVLEEYERMSVRLDSGGELMLPTVWDPDQLTPIVDEAGALWAQALSSVTGGLVSRLGSFWEGSCRVTGRCRGVAVTGVAFAELIKRYDDYLSSAGDWVRSSQPTRSIEAAVRAGVAAADALLSAV